MKIKFDVVDDYHKVKRPNQEDFLAAYTVLENGITICTVCEKAYIGLGDLMILHNANGAIYLSEVMG